MLLSGRHRKILFLDVAERPTQTDQNPDGAGRGVVCENLDVSRIAKDSSARHGLPLPLAIAGASVLGTTVVYIRMPSSAEIGSTGG
jgi:hypothetical protein